ncbi:MAG: ribulose-phosphate 3-epimerase [Proteobacteria bacterium]|nr:ribulose-phosphate 3-epimerase [Pseudomonadota bacterium]
MPIIAPSLLACDYLNFESEIEALNQSGVEYLHFDVMDGHFVPNLTFGAGLLSAIRKKTNLFLDVHLMVEDVFLFLNQFINAGANGIAIHIENTHHLHKAILEIKKHTIKAGVVLNPGTGLNVLDGILPFIDFVLFMSVNPGFGGQQFIPEVLHKVKTFKKHITQNNYPISISIDGGINRETAPLAVEAGCDTLIIGQAFFANGKECYKREYDFYNKLKEWQHQC